ncbi:hypothetical protein B0J13DRAFT_445605 [Dactylonectria estremocensis]|uniref:Alcohol dehydrogenase-like C-terminal domain-containing protein n=1 Tax=Dactylonectria estremocensis TaxID=1079267 RepID=A0A9P9EPK9_9HYPO|nr:hypothetical protein B0J13DRAFT_445605 [Dactylonectria estremocensis]
MALPTTMRGLVLHEDNSIKLDTALPVPTAGPGSVVVRVLATQANPNLVKMLRSDAGAHAFTQPRPLVAGGSFIGRVAAIGPDTTALAEGRLVVVEHFVRGRDDSGVKILWSMHDGDSPASKKLHLAWRNGSYAEFVRAPLENTYVLDEERLCSPVSDGGLGYSVNDLTHFIAQLVPYGGLRGANLQAGETVVISPATGFFSGSAIAVAMAMGANVVAVSRSKDGLARVKSTFPTVRTVQLSGDNKTDISAITTASGTHAPDVFLDLSPPAATGSAGVTACMMSVRPNGRIVLMGARGDANIPIPWPVLLYRGLTIKGGYMYEREDVRQAIRLLESGQTKLGKENGYEIAGTFGLEEWDECADAAVEHSGFGKIVLLNP